MPTPVSAARQCLAGEAAAALDEAVAIARRRGHAQTTSLHVVSALLSLPSSSSSLLRDALSRARSAAYSPRLQFKALELCFSVALDRLPSAASTNGGCGGGGNDNAQQPPAEPPVSNSLMAAIKRSQANQRRNPDTFHLYQHYQQQQQQNSSVVGVKVELQQLVLSILDDPVVSRVFGDAGFRSYDIKFAVLHPPPSILRFPRAARCPPLFLCNFSIGTEEFELTPRGFGFPFSSQPLCSDGADDNCRRIGEVLVRKKGRNPLLVGVGAADAARDFERAVGRQNWTAFPPELRGVKFFSIEKEVSEFARGGRDRSWVDSRFSEIALWLAAEECGASPGIVLSFGDLKGLVDVFGEGHDGHGLGRVSYVISEFTRVVHGHPGKLWLIGSASTYETYMKFLSQYPSVDKDWDLQLLPITSLKPGSGGLLPRPSSLMESFIPFGGLFPITSNSVASFSRQYQSIPCHLCKDKYDQEVATLVKEFSFPVGDKYQVNLPHQFQETDLSCVNNNINAEKAKDDGTVLSVKLMDIRKKWNDICQYQHQGSQVVVSNASGLGSEAFPHVLALPYVPDKVNSGIQPNGNIDGPQGQSFWGDAVPLTVSLQKISASQSMSFPLMSEFKNENLLYKEQIRTSNSEQLQTNGFLSHSGSLSDLQTPDELTSPSSVSSVSTDLMLGTVHTFPSEKESPRLHPCTKPLHDLPGCPTSKVNVIKENASAASLHYSSRLACSDPPVLCTCLPAQSSPAPKVTAASESACDQHILRSSNDHKAFDLSDIKTFCRMLVEKVCWQEEAIRGISQTLVCCKAGTERLHGASLRGDIWLTFLGPDKIGKRKTATALAELLFGSGEKLICVDLSMQDGLVCTNTVCANRGINGYDLSFRGKTVVDHITEEVRKKPCSVVLLESLDKADVLVQSSLSQAIKTGKISDSHGRETGINNVVFVTTTGAVKGKAALSSKEHVLFTEERILAAKARQMEILVVTAPKTAGSILCVSSSGTSKMEPSVSAFVSKRKLNMDDERKELQPSMATSKRANKASNTFLDLNLPVEGTAATDADYSSGESNSASDSLDPGAWMEEFLDAVDQTVVFRPFDFDALADEILKEINERIQTVIGSKCSLEIDPKVMEHILAASWSSEGKGALSNWLRLVLVRSFAEARQKYHLSSSSVLRLVACEDAPMEDHAPGILLPSRILLS